MNKIKICEIFPSIQGEGKYAGKPVIFIRTSGCTRKCDFCDTSYHNNGTEYTIQELINEIKKYQQTIIVWTGGEPLLQFFAIKEVITNLPLYYQHYIETNGDLIPLGNDFWESKISYYFHYICVSPKDLKTTENIYNLDIDEIKIVTDLELNKDMIPYATMLMPLTTDDEELNNKIEQDVWNYCVKNEIRFCLRQHYKVWGKKRGI